MVGTTLHHYRIVRALGSGGPASVRARCVARELRPGLAEAKRKHFR
jgi:hypothetical protein